MSWYCCGSSSFQRTNSKGIRPPPDSTLLPGTNSQLENNTAERGNDPTRKIHEFTYQQLLEATQRFRRGPGCVIGLSSIGTVYRGKIEETGEIVSVELWDRKYRNGSLDDEQFLRQLKLLSNLNHPNVVTLIGYCIEENQRLLVYEYQPLGSSLYSHLHGGPSNQKPTLNWDTRMKIALGIARGLECIHGANPPIIYFNLNTCTVFIDNDFNAKLSNFELFKLDPCDDYFDYGCNLLGFGSYGYRAPECITSLGLLTVKADVYTFGITLLELITGRETWNGMDLVSWAEPRLKKPKKFPELADPLLEGNYPANGLNQILVLVSKCLRLKESTRPMMSDVVAEIMCLASDNLNHK